MSRRFDHEDHAGMLSAVYVGDSLAAATMGVRSGDVLHGWVTGFERRFAKYSLGSILLVQLAQAAESLGIPRCRSSNPCSIRTR